MGVGAWAGTEGTLNDTDTADTDTMAVSNECHQVLCLVWHKNEIQYTVLDRIGDADIAAQ